MAVTISRIDLESLIGPECAAWLLARFGGQSLYVPKRKGAGQAIEAVVGAAAFGVLQAEFGAMNVSLPGKDKAPTLKAQIIPLIEAGLSHNEIAERLGCSWRHVAGVKQDMGLTKPTPRKKRQKPR
jgi:hypothetical protein